MDFFTYMVVAPSAIALAVAAVHVWWGLHRCRHESILAESLTQDVLALLSDRRQLRIPSVLQEGRGLFARGVMELLSQPHCDPYRLREIASRRARGIGSVGGEVLNWASGISVALTMLYIVCMVSLVPFILLLLLVLPFSCVMDLLLVRCAVLLFPLFAVPVAARMEGRLHDGELLLATHFEERLAEIEAARRGTTQFVLAGREDVRAARRAS